MTELVLTPQAEGVESLVFDPDDPITITNRLDYYVQSFEYTPAKPKTEWAESADTDGALPTNEDHYTNAEATLKIRVMEQATKDAALDAIGAIIAKGQLARRMVNDGERGLAVEWTPKGSTRTGTLYLIECDDWNVEMNVTDDPGYMLHNMPVFTVHMTFAPFVYAETVTESTLVLNQPVEGIATNIAGDVRTPGTVVLTDNASFSRKQATFAIGTDLTSPLYYFGGSISLASTDSHRVADSDAYSGGSVVELEGLFPGWQNFCGRPNVPHRGLFRVIVRAKSTTNEEQIELRLKSRVGNGPWRANLPATLSTFKVESFAEVDLGTVNGPPGNPLLDIMIEARSDEATAAGEGVRADLIQMLPANRYGVLEGEEIQIGGQVLGWHDGFDHDSPGDSLIGTSPEVGTGDWVEAGDADDWTMAVGYAYRRPAVADANLDTGQYAVAGGTLIDTTATFGFNLSHSGGSSSGQKEVRVGGLVRYQNINNWLGIFMRVKRVSSNSYRRWLMLCKRVAGTITTIEEVGGNNSTALTSGGHVVDGVVQISVDASGVVVVSTGPNPEGEVTQDTIYASDSDLATGGALEDGLVGIYHATDLAASKGSGAIYTITAFSSTSASEQTYAIPADAYTTLIGSEAVSSNSNPVPLRGASFMLEPGDQRLAFKARRNGGGERDIGLTNGTDVDVSYDPAYLAFPGS